MMIQHASISGAGLRPRSAWLVLRGRLSLAPLRHVPLRAQKEGEPGPSERSYESLFKEEIARRGLNGGAVTSSREETEPISGTASSRTNPFQPGATPRSTGRIGGSGSGAARSGAAPERDVEGQRERSIAMVNEGLEGLIPRASQLLQLGGSVFLAFLPFIVAISLVFGGIYYVFGDSFVHGGQAGKGLPAYIDAEALLAEPTVDPRIPYQ